MSAAIAGMLDITPNVAKATMQPKADTAASVVAPSLVLRWLTVTLRFKLSSQIARGELGSGVDWRRTHGEPAIFGGLLIDIFIAADPSRRFRSALVASGKCKEAQV
jgi:hypothetical protein